MCRDFCFALPALQLYSNWHTAEEPERQLRDAASLNQFLNEKLNGTLLHGTNPSLGLALQRVLNDRSGDMQDVLDDILMTGEECASQSQAHTDLCRFAFNPSELTGEDAVNHAAAPLQTCLQQGEHHTVHNLSDCHAWNSGV